MRNLKAVPLLILLFAFSAIAADVTGDWKGDLKTPRGTVQLSCTFKQDGEALTGTWQTAETPTVQISDGKVTGNKLSFVVNIADFTLAHEGTVKGDEIELVMKPSVEFPGATVIAKRVKR